MYLVLRILSLVMKHEWHDRKRRHEKNDQNDMKLGIKCLRFHNITDYKH